MSLACFFFELSCFNAAENGRRRAEDGECFEHCHGLKSDGCSCSNSFAVLKSHQFDKTLIEKLIENCQ